MFLWNILPSSLNEDFSVNLRLTWKIKFAKANFKTPQSFALGPGPSAQSPSAGGTVRFSVLVWSLPPKGRDHPPGGPEGTDPPEGVVLRTTEGGGDSPPKGEEPPTEGVSRTTTVGGSVPDPPVEFLRNSTTGRRSLPTRLRRGKRPNTPCWGPRPEALASHLGWDRRPAGPNPLRRDRRSRSHGYGTIQFTGSRADRLLTGTRDLRNEGPERPVVKLATEGPSRPEAPAVAKQPVF